MDSKDVDFIKKNWGTMSITNIVNSVTLDLYNTLRAAYELGLHNIKTPDLKRRWTKDEDMFLKDFASRITIPQACNLLHRSRYATYQRVKFLDLDEMVGKN